MLLYQHYMVLDFVIDLLSVTESILCNFELQFSLLQVAEFPVLLAHLAHVLVIGCLLFQVDVAQVQV